MERVARALAGALLLGLLALATWRADGGAPSWVLPLAAVTLGLGAAGLVAPPVRRSTPLSPTGAAAVWLVALSVAWAALMTTHEAYAWVAFGLFLLWLMHLPLRLAAPAVLLLTAVVGVVELSSTDGRWGGVLGPSLAAVACIVGAWTMTRLRQESEARAAAMEELQQTRAALAAAHAEAGALDERHRIARDLHDTVVQSFTSVLLLARSREAAPGEAPDPLLARIEAVAVDGLAESRRVVEALRAEPGRTLVDALRQVADGVVSPPTQVEVRGDQRPLPTAVEVGLLRIAQGALGNVSEHAGATRATVAVTYLADQVRLEVTDDGRGGARLGQASASGRGSGLSGARDRAHELGGSLEIFSPPGRGTRVTVEVPA